MKRGCQRRLAFPFAAWAGCTFAMLAIGPAGARAQEKKTVAPPAEQAAVWTSDQGRGQHVIIGDAVYNLETLQPVSTGLPPEVCEGRPVKGAPGVFLKAPGDRAGIAATGDNTRRVQLIRPGQAYASGPAGHDLYKTVGSNEVVVSADYRRVAYLKDGDWWRADIDWTDGSVKNHKQATRIGLFKGSQNAQPVHAWFGNYLYVHGGFDEVKPEARIDLVSGDVQELEQLAAMHAPDRNMDVQAFTNPARDRVFQAVKTSLAVFEPFADKAYVLPNSMMSGGQEVMLLGGYEGVEKVIWVNDDTALAGGRRGAGAVADFARGEVRVLRQGGERVEVRAYLPGNVLMADIVERPEQIGRAAASGDKTRTVVNFVTGEKFPVALDPDTEIAWVNDRLGVYYVEQGGLSKIGTWLLDLKTGKSARINNTKPALHKEEEFGRPVYVPGRDEIVITPFESGGPITVVKSDGSNPRTIDVPKGGPQSRAPRARLIPAPVELHYGKPADELWDPARYKHRAAVATAEPIGQSAAAGVAAGAGAGATLAQNDDVRWNKAMEGKDAKQRQGYTALYKYAKNQFLLSQITDPVELATKMAEQFERQYPGVLTNPPTPQRPGPNQEFGIDDYIPNVLEKMDVTKLIKRERAQQFGYNRALGMLSSHTPEQREQLATAVGNGFADELMKKPTISMYTIDHIYGQVYTEVQRGASMTAQQQEQQQPPQQQQEQQQAQKEKTEAEKKGDEAARKARKAADTARGIGDLFKKRSR